MLFSLSQPGKDGSHVSTRREVLTAGALTLMGLSAERLEQLRAAAPPEKQHHSCVFVFLFGGPSQIDLWDMKPSAPAEIRGEFTPQSSKVPGIQVCEHLPRFAAQMDKLCLLRSMTHNMNVHGPACSEIFSGREYFGAPTTDQATSQDWPSLSSLVMRYGRTGGAMPPSIVLPWYLQFPGQAKRIAGQSGGRMGERYNAMLVQGREKEGFENRALQLHGNVSVDRLRERRRLLQDIQQTTQRIGMRTDVGVTYQQHRRQAFRLLETRAAELLDLDREKTQTREAYGSTLVGKSLLMARRLVEAGVSLVTVNWQDETKTDGVNTCWDTHQNNFPKLKNLLCPIFDQAFPAFIADLDQRGLLETTLVVAVGEFGRTPHMGQFSQSSNTRKTGRDHWPSVFTAIVAGGGVRGGQAFGASNSHGAFVKDRPVSPADLSATILHHLGVDHRQAYRDEMQGLYHALSEGKPITDL